MNWYSHKTYKQHLIDLDYLNLDDERKELCLKFVRQVANGFERSYSRVGVLDLTDLIQEGYAAALHSWKTLDMEKINDLPIEADNDEQIAVIWNYIRLAIKHGIGNAIKKYRDGIRIPKQYFSEEWQGREYQTDIFLTKTFAAFFNESYMELLAYQGESYQNEKLNEFLNDIMEEHLDHMTMTVIKMVYGMDEPFEVSKPFKSISDWIRKPPATVRKIKQRGIDKLKEEEVIIKIEKFLLQTVTN